MSSPWLVHVARFVLGFGLLLGLTRTLGVSQTGMFHATRFAEISSRLTPPCVFPSMSKVTMICTQWGCRMSGKSYLIMQYHIVIVQYTKL